MPSPCPFGSCLPQPASSAASSATLRSRPVSIGIGLERLAVVPPRRGDLLARIDDARRSDQLEQEVLRVLAQLMRDLGDERLDRPGVHHVVDRPEPADPHVALRLAALHADVGHVERRIDPAHAELDVEGMLRIGREGGQDGRRRAAMPPGDHLVAGVEAGLEALRRHGVIEAVLHVVLARPHHLDRRAAQLLGQQRRLDGEVALGLAAEAAAEQRGVHRHLLGLDAERLGDVVARAARGFAPAPTPPTCRPVMRAAAAGGSMVAWREMRRVVLGRDHLGGRGQRLVGVAVVALDLAGLLHGSLRAAPGRPWSRRPCWARRPR